MSDDVTHSSDQIFTDILFSVGLVDVQNTEPLHPHNVLSLYTNVQISFIRGLSKKFVDICNFIQNSDGIISKVSSYFNIEHNIVCL